MTWRPSAAAKVPAKTRPSHKSPMSPSPTSRQAQHHHQSLCSAIVESRKCGGTHGSRTAAAEYLAGFCRFPKINSPSWNATTAGIPPALRIYQSPRPSSARQRRPTSSPTPQNSTRSPNRRLPPLHPLFPVRSLSPLPLRPARYAKDPRRPTLMRRTLGKDRFPGLRPLPGISGPTHRQTQSLWKASRHCQPSVCRCLGRHRDH